MIIVLEEKFVGSGKGEGIWGAFGVGGVEKYHVYLFFFQEGKR